MSHFFPQKSNTANIDIEGYVSHSHNNFVYENSLKVFQPTLV